jgi:hypothetical protein
MHADSDPRRATCRPLRCQRPRSDGRSGHSLRTRLVVRQQNFGNSANELQMAIGACRSAAGFCYE